MSSRLTDLADGFAAYLNGLCTEGTHASCIADRRLEHLPHLARLAEATKTSLRNSVQGDSFDASGRTTRLNAKSYRRGVIGERIMSPRTADLYPLHRFTAMYSHRMVLAPVRSTFILADRRVLIFGGPLGSEDFITMWCTEWPEAIDAAVQFTNTQLAEGEEVQLMPPTEVNERRLQVLIHVLQGLTDAAIARTLTISLRSVERDVATLKEIAGVSSRVELLGAAGYDVAKRP